MSFLLISILLLMPRLCQSKIPDSLDITLYSNIRLTSSAAASFRGYALKDSKTMDLSVGILYKNIERKSNVTWEDTGSSSSIDGPAFSEQSTNMPSKKIFSTDSYITYRIHGDFVYLGVRSLTSTERSGVFSFEAKKDGVVTKSAIVLTSSAASIAMKSRTLTVGIGESVTINLDLDKGATKPDLRWRHNYGQEINKLNGNTSVTIENIRTKDDGVYECYTGSNPDGNHGIMRLIVRDCPSPRWNPPECEEYCPVCYNGGVCDHETGNCICPAGFKGNNCEEGCGSNNWGRDCNVVCGSNNPEGCIEALLCPPDPVGCTCIDGYGGDNCNTGCTGGFYGSGCLQECHCNSDSCDRKYGCPACTTCNLGFNGHRCLNHTFCHPGWFGVICNFPCHCKDSIECNQDGSCDNGCDEAWAGEDCSIALPYGSRPPTVVDKTATTLTVRVTWTPGEDFGTGTIKKLKLFYKTPQMNSPIGRVNSTSDGLFVIGGLSPHMNVTFYSKFSRLIDGQEQYGPDSVIGSAEIICEKPLVEPEMQVKNIENNSFVLKPVINTAEQIQCESVLRYQIKYYKENSKDAQVMNTTDSSQTVSLELSKCVAYTLMARVVNNEEIAGNYGKNLSVLTAPPGPIINSTSVNTTSVLVTWSASTCENSTIQVTYFYELLGETSLQGNTTETEFIINEIKPCKQYTFTVLASYKNVNGTSDKIEIFSEADCPQPSSGSALSSWIIALVVIICIAPAVIIFLVILKRRRFKKLVERPPSSEKEKGPDVKPTEFDNEDYDNTSISGLDDCILESEPVYGNTRLENQEYKPIDLKGLHDYVLKRQQSAENGFEKEFKDLGDKPLYHWKVAKSSINKKKNRYANVIPYDHSRVVLDLIDDAPGSDYINASYLDGYTTPREFIGCQGPNTASVNDMWRMIWQEKCFLIVAVTNVIEGTKKKCEQYWPELYDSKSYGNLLVMNVEEKNYGHYVVRTLQVQPAEHRNKVHNVSQFHFTEWPDKSVPRAVPQLTDFIRAFRTQQKNSQSPVIVHCSAGAGRTGTVITIAAMLDMAKEEGKVDVYHFVKSMREKRIQMVQTEEQYRFIYAVLLEKLFCGQTEIPIGDFQTVMHKQKHMNRTSEIEYQLKTLNSLFPRPSDDLTSHGRQSDNIFKNRFTDVLPLNSARPLLMSQYENGTDYINATFCNGYLRRNAFIVAQAPLSDPVDTTVDFWRLVFDYNSNVIVQLNDMKDPTSAWYFSQRINHRMNFGQFIVTVTSSKQNGLITERKLVIEKDNTLKEVKHYEFRKWPKAEHLPNVDRFVPFVASIRDNLSASNQPIIVHCLDGVSRCGLFCSVYSIIDRIKHEKVVDVFQTLKTLRLTCPTTVNSEAQYNFCFEAAECYIKGFAEYINI